MDLFQLHRGDAPLVVSIPHSGTYVPPTIAAVLTDPARALPDTDWHVERLYDFAAAMGATVLVATHARYVVDLNRDPDGQALYTGQDETGVVPTTGFDRAPIYRSGHAPDLEQVRARVERYWRPYHAALGAEIKRLRASHPKVVLFDAHSIRSQVPRFFSGELPNLNLGSRGGESADPGLVAVAKDVLAGASDYTLACDGRFRGGYITRAGGRPERGVHALQLEMAQRTYMNEAPPYAYQPERAAGIRPTLRALLQALLDWARESRA